jgi:hypothetical protein
MPVLALPEARPNGQARAVTEDFLPGSKPHAMHALFDEEVQSIFGGLWPLNRCYQSYNPEGA